MRGIAFPALFVALLLAACGKDPSAFSPAPRSALTIAPAHGPALQRDKPAPPSLAFLAGDAIDLPTVLPAPPAAGSAEDAADLAEVLRVQASRSVADCDRARSEAVVTLAHFYGAPHGPLSAEQVARLEPTFSLVFTDANFFIQKLKLYWHRPRPFLVSQDVRPCLPLDLTGSYPSGHSTSAFLFARILSDLYPGLRDTFHARAAEIAQDRVLAGLHNPSDIAAGEPFAAILYAKLQASAAFRSAIAKLK